MVAKTSRANKMIELEVRLWTNNIGERGLIPKHAWDAGTVAIRTNSLHGIESNVRPVPFHSLASIGPAVEKVLRATGVTIHPGRFTGKFIARRVQKS